MKATVTYIAKRGEAIEVIAQAEGKTKIFSFPFEVKATEITKSVKDWLRELKAKKDGVEELSAALLNKEIEL